MVLRIGWVEMPETTKLVEALGGVAKDYAGDLVNMVGKGVHNGLNGLGAALSFAERVNARAAQYKGPPHR